MPRIVFQGANLLDGDQPARAGSTVVVEGDRIVTVGRGGKPEKVETRPDDRIVDLRADVETVAGKRLAPSRHHHLVAAIEDEGAVHRQVLAAAPHALHG